MMISTHMYASYKQIFGAIAKLMAPIRIACLVLSIPENCAIKKHEFFIEKLSKYV